MAKRLQYQALAFVPIAVVAAGDSATTAPGQSGGPTPITRSLTQYQDIAAPVVVPAGAAETITLDKWEPQYPDRVWRLGSAPPGGSIGPLYVPDVTVVAPTHSADAVYPDRVPGRPRVVQFPLAVAPLHVPDVTQPVTARSWAPIYPDRVPPARRAADFPQAVAPVFVPDVTQPVTPLAWTPTYPDRYRRAPRAADFPQTVAPLYVADVTVTAPTHSWDAVYPDRVWRLAQTRLPASVDPVAPVGAAPVETITPDKWLGRYPDRVWRVVGRIVGGAVAPVFVPDVTQPVTSLAWTPRYADRLNRPVRAPLPAHVGPVAPVDVVAETITLDKWRGQYPDAVARVRLRPSIWLVQPVLVAEPGLALWTPRYPDRVWAKPRTLVPGGVGPLYIPDVTVQAPRLSWQPVYPDRAPGRRPVLQPNYWFWSIETLSGILVPVTAVDAAYTPILTASGAAYTVTLDGTTYVLVADAAHEPRATLDAQQGTIAIDGEVEH